MAHGTHSNSINDFGDRTAELAANPKIVFLPFSESLMKPTTKRDTHQSCWQRNDARIQHHDANYPVFASEGDNDSLSLVPYDQEYMSLSIKKNGCWETLAR